MSNLVDSSCILTSHRRAMRFLDQNSKMVSLAVLYRSPRKDRIFSCTARSTKDFQFSLAPFQDVSPVGCYSPGRQKGMPDCDETRAAKWIGREKKDDDETRTYGGETTARDLGTGQRRASDVARRRVRAYVDLHVHELSE
jgi:hypothetical protein